MSEGQELFSGVSPQKRSSADGADVLLTMGSPSKRANLGKPSEFNESKNIFDGCFTFKCLVSITYLKSNNIFVLY